LFWDSDFGRKYSLQGYNNKEKERPILFTQKYQK